MKVVMKSFGFNNSRLQVRSHSESEGLNRARNALSLDQLKLKMSRVPETKEEESGCDSESDSDSNPSQSGSSTDLANPPAETDQASRTAADAAAKKRVRFADDCGCELTVVRVMSEPSDCPPLISAAVLRRFRGPDWEGEPSLDEYGWTVSFPQPASEYVKFREKIEAHKVSLENIVVRNDQHRMTGTIKVANISFEKRVFVRYTTNGWQSYLDRPATFQQCANRMHDTFTFDIEIPKDPPDGRIEFCVCYVAGGIEHWDSREGQNYVLLSQNKQQTSLLSPHQPLFGSFRDRDDAYNKKIENWSSFASWKHLSVEGPYW